eukprot:TRINITY_DN5694_c0_g1_i1.p1 TRINITY_DN5694_c0_g1~~TRINITY_DN5694_c0_g1_i1.p1  ORF type:complete len:337 (-),score=45.82 TRINITY_DN5694_c0_g1_i1:163-1173(-)
MRIVILVICYIIHLVAAQWAYGTPKWQQEYEKNLAAALEILQNHEDLENTYYPNKYDEDIDQYEFSYPTDYFIELLVDPCKDQANNCCDDTYGSPQYETIIDDEIVEIDAQGNVLLDDESRRADDLLIMDSTCKGYFDPTTDCVTKGVRRKAFPILPNCWDNNKEVVATAECRTALDKELPCCVEIGFSQSAYIVQCGGAYLSDNHCGTFLEVHESANPSIINEQRLVGQYTSGFRKSYIKTTWSDHEDRVLCRGTYELWWVQRTRHNFVVEKVKQFEVTDPECDWDAVNEVYFPYHELTDAEKAYNQEVSTRENIQTERQKYLEMFDIEDDSFSA